MNYLFTLRGILRTHGHECHCPKLLRDGDVSIDQDHLQILNSVRLFTLQLTW